MSALACIIIGVVSMLIGAIGLTVMCPRMGDYLRGAAVIAAIAACLCGLNLIRIGTTEFEKTPYPHIATHSICVECNVVSKEDDYCDLCRNEVQTAYKRCVQCKEKARENRAVCSNCAASLLVRDNPKRSN